MAEDLSNNRKKLLQSCDDAYNKYPKSCSHSVWHVIQQYKPDQHYMNANQLINHLSTNAEWQEVHLSELSKLASNGVLVVGGAKQDGHGHVIVVYPGPEKPKGGFYFKDHTGKKVQAAVKGSYALAMSTSMGSFPGARSKGEKTIRDPWGNETKFQQVKFWKYLGPKNKVTPAESAVK
jgi:hypothetical protein